MEGREKVNIAIVTDSTAVLDKELAMDDHLFMIPIPVIIDGQSQYNVEAEVFYPRLTKSDTFPTTSQPSPGEILSLYEQIFNQGFDHIISIHISSGISGFCQTLQGLVAVEYPQKVTVFDSLSTSLPMGVMVEQALKLVHQNKTVDEIMIALEKIREAQAIYLVVDDLHHLVRSGRLSNGTALIGSLLNIKPILKFDDHGQIVLAEKIRTAKKAYKKAMNLVEEELFVYQAKQWEPILGIAHANDEAKAHQLAEQLAEQTKLPVRVVDLGIVIGTHTGEKTIGFGIMRDVIKEEK